MDKIDEAILIALSQRSRGADDLRVSLSFFYDKFSAKHPVSPEEIQARIRALAQQGYLRAERAGKHSILVAPTQAGLDYAARKQGSKNRAPLIVLTVLILSLLVVTALCILLSPAVLESLKPLAQVPVAARQSTAVQASTAVGLTSTPTRPPRIASPTPPGIDKPTVAPVFIANTPTPEPSPTPLPPTAAAPMIPTAEVVAVLPTDPPPAPFNPGSSLVQFTDKQILTDKNMLVTVRQPLVDPVTTGAEAGFNRFIKLYTNFYWGSVRGSQPVPDPGGFLTIDYTIISRPEWAPANNPVVVYASTETLPVKNAVLSGGHEVVSVLFAAESYTGGAHPGTTYEIINYDFTTGLQLQLQDLFRPDTPYLDTIASYAIFELSKQESLLFPDYRQGAAALPENYRVWGLTPRGLLVIFAEYQVAPYASGAQAVLIPYTALAGMIDPQGPLGKYAQ